MTIIRNPIIGGAHALTVDQLADLGEALQWHAMHWHKLNSGDEDGVTYQDAAEYRDEALMRAGLPPMDIIKVALHARADARVIARESKR